MNIDNTSLIGHWPLAADAADHSPLQHQAIAVDIQTGFEGPNGLPGTAGRFNGTTSVLSIVDREALRPGPGGFSFAAWIKTEEATDVVGDIVSKFDPAGRNGFQLSILSNLGVTSTAQPNYRHLHFGIDAGHLDQEWTDCGRPGNAKHIHALASVNGHLYAGTVETGTDEMGRLWRHEGGQEWRPLGNPVGCNSIDSIAQFRGELYCGLGRYKTRGSLLGEKELNPVPGGQVFKLDAEGNWIFCGHPGAEDAVPEEIETNSNDSGKADEATALTVFNGALYCTSHHRRGIFRYEGGRCWVSAGLETERILSFGIYRHQLYALVNGGPVYRLEADGSWNYCGCPDRSTQTYSSAICGGEFYVGTWPEGEVFRYEGEHCWTKVQRVGYEREVMPMVMYNGKLYLGTLPMANVFRMDGSRFTFLHTLDHSSAALRRVWSMAVHGGSLFAGMLPSGRVKSIEAGKAATWNTAFPPGWHHVAAVREADRLSLYVDGQCRAHSAAFSPNTFDLNNDRPLLIGNGPFSPFTGLMSDVRLYGRALQASEIQRLAALA